MTATALQLAPYKLENTVRVITATSLFDGHDASISIMRRILQSTGAEVIHLGNNRYIGEHRLVMEKAVGRKLKRHEHVHHINRKRDDNRPENLELINWSEHGKKHGRPKGSFYSTTERKKQSERMKQWWAKRKAKQG